MRSFLNNVQRRKISCYGGQHDAGYTLGGRALRSFNRQSVMKWSDWFLGIIATVALGVICYLTDLNDKQVLTTPEIIVHGYSSTN